ncbi:MAG TPA: neutral zinc metallopeptidase [Candidatus Saccharimonadales bacterium]
MSPFKRAHIALLAALLFVAGCSSHSASEDSFTSPSITTDTVTSAPASGSNRAGDSSEKLNQPLPEANSAFQDSRMDQGLTYQYVTDYLTAVVKDADRVWVEYFASIGLREPDVYYTIIQPDTAYESQCSATPLESTYNNATYCPIDVIDGFTGAIWLPADTFANMWNGSIFTRQSVRKGDFGAAVVTAHEFGHHIQHELKDQLGWPEIKAADGSRIKEGELIADCFAGNWAFSAFYSNYLEAGDIEEGVAALIAIGDSEPGGDDPHGSPTERAEAFMLGYNSGAPADCINEYWPGVTV